MGLSIVWLQSKIASEMKTFKINYIVYINYDISHSQRFGGMITLHRI